MPAVAANSHPKREYPGYQSHDSPRPGYVVSPEATLLNQLLDVVAGLRKEMRDLTARLDDWELRTGNRGVV